VTKEVGSFESSSRLGENMLRKPNSPPSISGVIPILPTPFDDQGEVDERDFARVVEASLADGVNGVAMFGLASEAYKLTDAERRRLSVLLIEQVAGRVPVIISVTHHSLEVAVQESAWAEKSGADAIMVMPPYLMSPGEAAVRNHIAAIASAVDLPVIIQYAPLQTGTTLSAETLTAIHRAHSNVTYVKIDQVPSGPMITSLQNCTRSSLRTIVGYMGLHLPNDVLRGVSGVMPTVSLGRAFVRLFQLLHAGADEGRKLHQKLLPLLNFMMQSVEMLIAVEKQLLVRRGILRSARCRCPAWTIDSFHIAELEQHAADLAEWLPAFLPKKEQFA
jgi:dihydrodipicolinate synthase/N-acetylneuraminate lyase